MGVLRRTVLIRAIFLFILVLVSCPLALSWAEYDRAPVVSVEMMHNDPGRYDSTFMRNLIAITGNIVDIGHDWFEVENEGDTIRVGKTTVNQMVGFEVGDEVKVVGYYFKPRQSDDEHIKPLYVMRYPVKYTSASIEELIAQPEKYNGMVVTVQGKLTGLERASEFQQVLSLDDNPQMKINYVGLTALRLNTTVRIKGLVNYKTIYADEVKELTALTQILSYMQYLLGGLAAMAVVYLFMRRI
ncbi:MAG: hypothetical protein ACXQS4_01355 [Methermicoccaceae archaeon]